MRYQNLAVWQRSRSLTIDVYKTLSHSKDFGFKDQITRSALSVPSNIAEGFERASTKETCRFLNIAVASLAEFLTQTDIGLNAGLIPVEKGSVWLSESKQLSLMVKAVILKLENLQ
jgi:four helix bundle protein